MVVMYLFARLTAEILSREPAEEEARQRMEEEAQRQMEEEARRIPALNSPAQPPHGRLPPRGRGRGRGRPPPACNSPPEYPPGLR